MAEEKKPEDQKPVEPPKKGEQEKESTVDKMKRGALKFLKDAAEGQKILDSTSMFKKGGKVSSASKRADGCAIRGKTRGRMV